MPRESSRARNQAHDPFPVYCKYILTGIYMHHKPLGSHLTGQHVFGSEGGAMSEAKHALKRYENIVEGREAAAESTLAGMRFSVVGGAFTTPRRPTTCSMIRK